MLYPFTGDFRNMDKSINVSYRNNGTVALYSIYSASDYMTNTDTLPTDCSLNYFIARLLFCFSLRSTFSSLASGMLKII